jgi:cation transport ATPase
MEKFDINLEQAMELLNLKPGFTEAEFKAKYRDLIKNIHPDTLGNINEIARNIIEDEVKRVNIAKGVIESFLKENEYEEEQEKGQENYKKDKKAEWEKYAREKEREQQEQPRKREEEDRQKGERDQWQKHEKKKKQQDKERTKRENQPQNDMFASLLFTISIPFFIFYLIRSIETRSIDHIIITIMSFVIFFLCFETMEIKDNNSNNKGISTLFICISIPFFIFYLIKSIQTISIDPVIITIMSLIIFYFSYLMVSNRTGSSRYKATSILSISIFIPFFTFYLIKSIQIRSIDSIIITIMSFIILYFSYVTIKKKSYNNLLGGSLAFISVPLFIVYLIRIILTRSIDPIIITIMSFIIFWFYAETSESNRDISQWEKLAKEKEKQDKEKIKREKQEQKRKDKEQRTHYKSIKLFFKDILKFIPGFRTGFKWKMAVALIYYTLCLISIKYGIGLLLFYISMPFFIFYLIKSIKTKSISSISITIISFILLCIGMISVN